MNRPLSTGKKIFYVLAGALLTGAMWRARGSHGWGSEWGVFTVGLLLMVYVFAVFGRRTNATYFLIITAAASCMATVPAWGTLLNQTSGFFESHATKDVAVCTPASGVFIMFCLGFGTMPLFLFLMSRLFSDKRYSIWKYIAVPAVFFAVFYLASATVAPLLVRLIQPEAVKAFEGGLTATGTDGTAYSVFMQHFTNINWAKKLPYGRNYFTEIAVVAHAVAAAAEILFLRFAFKDRAGAKVTFWGCFAFGFGITAANIFFVLKNKLTVEAHPRLDSAWSFWEFFTGFIAALILLTALFVIDREFPDEGFRDDLIPSLPEKIKTALLWAFVFVFGFGVSSLRPIAARLDESDVLPIIVYAVGGVILLVLSVLMLKKRLPFFPSTDPVKTAPLFALILFTFHMLCYMFVGYTAECPPHILEHDSIQIFMLFAVPLFYVIYLPTAKDRLRLSKKEI